jgi:hypothetical protein
MHKIIQIYPCLLKLSRKQESVTDGRTDRQTTAITISTKSIKFGLKIILIHLTSIINLIIPFHSVFVTIQQSERNFFL